MEWVALAAAIGLGLLSKQVMAAFIGLMFVFPVVNNRDRYLLKSPRPYLVSLFALAALIPPILWNAHHGWITFHHTASHFERGPSNLIATSAEFIGGQIGIVSPVTWILFAVLSRLLLFRFQGTGPSRALFAVFQPGPAAPGSRPELEAENRTQLASRILSRRNDPFVRLGLWQHLGWFQAGFVETLL